MAAAPSGATLTAVSTSVDAVTQLHSSTYEVEPTVRSSCLLIVWFRSNGLRLPPRLLKGILRM